MVGNMGFKQEIEILSNISMKLLQNLEPEPIYVKNLIQEICEKLRKKGG